MKLEGRIRSESNLDAPATALSVVIPIHAGEPRYLRQLRCLVRQGARLGLLASAVELVVVTTTELSGRVEALVRGSDFRLTIIESRDASVRVSAARNLGLQRSQGGYIAFLDADDIADLSVYLRVTRTCESMGAQVGRLSFAEVPERDLMDWPAESEIPESPIRIRGRRAAVWSYVFHREWLLRADVTFPRRDYAEDIEFLIRLGNRPARVVTSDAVGYLHMTRPAQTLGTSPTRNDLSAAISEMARLAEASASRVRQQEAALWTFRIVYRGVRLRLLTPEGLLQALHLLLRNPGMSAWAISRLFLLAANPNRVLDHTSGTVGLTFRERD